MIIKLQPDQIPLFWDIIRHGVIQAYNIPIKFQQDFVIKYFEYLLSGRYQCWVGYKLNEVGEKEIQAIMCTKIVEEKDYGIRSLALIGVYGYRMITGELLKDTIDALEQFARLNNCEAMYTEYISKRVESIVEEMGFEKHITIARKIL